MQRKRQSRNPQSNSEREMSNSNENPKASTLPPTSPFNLTNGLTLSPRIKLNLTIHRSDNSVSALDEWKLKNSLTHLFKTSFSRPILIPQEDLIISRFKDLKKRKRQDPVAVGSLFIRDLSFVSLTAKQALRGSGVREEDADGDVLAAEEGRQFVQWRKVFVEKMDGMEVNLEGVRFRVSVSVPVCDDFELLKKELDEFFAFRDRGATRGLRKEPDTVVLRGLPSRWFAEPRVSSKPSMLVTHAIFSTLGKIRNLNVAEDDDLGKDTDADEGLPISGLHCKVMVQFEEYKEFIDALRVLCSRSLQKEGSRMKADYQLAWDKDGFFQSVKYRVKERNSRYPTVGSRRYEDESPRQEKYSSRYSPDDVRSKRYKE